MKKRVFEVAASLIVLFLVGLGAVAYFAREKLEILGVVGNKERYEIKEDIVTDKLTGLVWQKGHTKDLSQYDALKHCDSLQLAGHDDWRLPSVSELKTLISDCQNATDLCNVSDVCLSTSCQNDDCGSCEGQKGPGEKGYYWQKGVWEHIDDEFGFFWSSSITSDEPDTAWTVAFYQGFISNAGRSNSEGYYTRCVRGKLASQGLKKNDYDVNADIVVDRKVGFMWQRFRVDKKMNQIDADKYCSKLDLGGYLDWRLPTISELRTIIRGCPGSEPRGSCKVNDDCVSLVGCWTQDDCWTCKSGEGPGENGYYQQKGVWLGGGEWLWSSSVWPPASWGATKQGAWGVGMEGGDIGYCGDRKVCQNDVRCIRRGSPYPGGNEIKTRKIEKLKENIREPRNNIGRCEVKEEVVADKETGLIWQRGHSEKIPHYKAMQYCDDLVIGGYSDWYLPSISELKTLIVGCRSALDTCKVSDNCLSLRCWGKPCYCDKKRGPGEKGFYWQKEIWRYEGNEYGQFWSSSFQSDEDNAAAVVSFFSGTVGYADRDSIIYVRCVRSE